MVLIRNSQKMADPAFEKSGFTELVEILDHRLNNTKLDENYNKVKHDMLSAKTIWLYSSILYNELQNIAYKSDFVKSEHLLEEDKLSSELRDAITFTELNDYLSLSSMDDMEHRLMGIMEADLHRLDSFTPIKPSLLNWILQKLESQLKAKCQKLLDFWSPAKSETLNDKLKFSQCTQLPAVVEAHIRQMEVDRVAIHMETRQQVDSFWDTYETIMQSFEYLEKLVNEHKLKHIRIKNKTHAKYLIAKCDCLSLKIQCLELQMKCDMYHPDTIQALKIIKRELEDATSVTSNQIQNSAQLLNTYESVGLGFNELVMEYNELQKQLENQQWSLSQLTSKK